MPLLQDISNWLGQLTETNRMRLGMDSESGSAVEIQQRLDSATEKAWALEKRLDACMTRSDAMPTGRQVNYRGYTLGELENGWWRVVNKASTSGSNMEPSLDEMKRYVDQMEAFKRGDAEPKMPAYDPVAVNKEIAKDKRIGGVEAKAIHALLKGRG